MMQPMLPEDPLQYPAQVQAPAPAGRSASVTLFVCGDLMIGRGVDQILPHPGDGRLHEPYMTSARGYVELAERANGPIPVPVGFDYVWGDALGELDWMRPALRVANLETAVTARGKPWPNKGIHYRVHPANLGCLTVAALDACSLANNHVLDWDRVGLDDTLQALATAGIRAAGAGGDDHEAAAPALLALPQDRRLLLLGYCTTSSGVPSEWAATATRAGVNLLPDLSLRTVEREAQRIAAIRKPGDLVVASIHWGGNWGYSVPHAHREFARGLIDAGVDLVHGHSSHHPQPIEVYRNRAILYGCGDLINDYEGIGGYEAFRPELSLMYFVALDASGALQQLRMSPMRMRRMRLQRADERDAQWLARQLGAEGARLRTRVEIGADALWLRW
jgi:poly-gamma-glutamate capsule biosynthesis protein CapA/YwtB (metallophosphatase superfamily)